MRGVTFGGNRTIEYVEIEDPVPGPGEVVLEMKASGICGSDLHMYRGTGQPLLGAASSTPVIKGHEPCGVVAAVGAGVSERQAYVGERVMVHHYWGCGVCSHCRSGWAQMCDQVRPIVYGSGAGHGGHAPYMKVPAGTLVHLPDELSFEAGSAISCGTGTAYAALKRLHVAGGDNITIFGQGPVGLAGTQLAAAMGARVIAVDLSDERLVLAKQMGAAEVINSAKTDPVEEIRRLTGKGADLSMDASGATEARHAGLESLRPWGSLALVGVGGDFNPKLGWLMSKQCTVFGSFTFSDIGQADCARYAAQANVPVDAIFTDRWTLDQADEAYKIADSQTAGKGVILPNLA
jgi:threonine dehydrogenase-like Zn-dependent dehydrogenase